MNYEQMEMDLTLEIDRSLKDNMQTAATFALKQIMEHEKPQPIRNRHEGYGVEAECYENLGRASKAVAAEMKALLSMLPNSDGEFLNYCGSLYNSAIENACASIKLAAHARRIMTDLYDSSPTPIEQYADSLGEDADGFEEAGEDQPEAEELGNDDDFEEKNEED